MPRYTPGGQPPTIQARSPTCRSGRRRPDSRRSPSTAALVSCEQWKRHESIAGGEDGALNQAAVNGASSGMRKQACKMKRNWVIPLRSPATTNIRAHCSGATRRERTESRRRATAEPGLRVRAHGRSPRHRDARGRVPHERAACPGPRRGPRDRRRGGRAPSERGASGDAAAVFRNQPVGQSQGSLARAARVRLALFLREQRGARIFGEQTDCVADVCTRIPPVGDTSMRIRTGQLHSSTHADRDLHGIDPDGRFNLPSRHGDATPDDVVYVAALESIDRP